MKKIIFIIVVAMLLASCGNTDGSTNKQDEEEVKRNYINDLEGVVTDILTNATNAEEMIITYSNLWSSNIDHTITGDEVKRVLDLKDDSEVEKHFGATGLEEVSFSGDFDTIISKVNQYYNDIGKTETLNTTSDEIQSQLKELNEPPEEYKEIYDLVVDFYSVSEEYVGLAVSPEGSLTSFNDTTSELSSEILSIYEEIEIKMPDLENNNEEIE